MEVLLLIDIQNDYFPGGKFPLRKMKKAALNAGKLLELFRREKKTVIHVRHISVREPVRFFEKDTYGSEINSLVAPKDGEKVIIKHYPNSFRETELDRYLRDLNVTKLHIAGAMTNMCIDSTVRAGFDLGYKIVLHKNACTAVGILGTGIVHLISVKTLGSSFAEVE